MEKFTVDYMIMLLLMACGCSIVLSLENVTTLGDGAKILNIVQGGNFQTLNNHGGFHIKNEGGRGKCPPCDCNNTELINIVRTFFTSNNTGSRTINFSNKSTATSSDVSVIRLPGQTENFPSELPKQEIEFLSEVRDVRKRTLIPPIMEFMTGRLMQSEPVDITILRYQDKISMISDQIKTIILEETKITCDTTSLKKVLLCISQYIGDTPEKNVKILSLLLNLISNFLSEYNLRTKFHVVDPEAMKDVVLTKINEVTPIRTSRSLLSADPDSLYASEIDQGTTILRLKPDEYGLSERFGSIMDGGKHGNLDALEIFKIFRVPCDRKHNDINLIDEIEVSAIIKPHFSPKNQLCFTTILCPLEYYFDMTSKSCNLAERDLRVDTEIDLKALKLSSVFSRVSTHPFESILPRLKKSYCKIDNHPLRKCIGKVRKMEKNFMAIHIGKEWVLVDGDYLLTMVQDSKDIRGYYCEPDAGSVVTDENCRGDEAFVKVFGKGDSKCYCKLNNFWHDLVFKNLDGISFIDAWIAFTWDVEIDSKVYDSLSCSDCDFRCENGVINYTVKKYIDLIKICFLDHCILRDVEQSEGLLNIPEIRFYGTQLKLTLFSNTKPGEFSTNILCTDSDICSTINCFFCLERLANFHCLSSYLLILYVLILLVLFLLLSIFYKILKIIKSCIVSAFMILKFSYKFVRYVFIKIYKACKTKLRISYNRVVELDEDGLWDSPRSQAIEMEQRSYPEYLTSTKVLSTSRRPRVLPAGGYTMSIILIIYSFFILSALGCSDIGSINTQDISCTDTGTTISCSTDFNLMLTVAPMGQYACIQAKSIEGRVIMSIRIKTTSIKLICNKRSLYYTYKTTPTISKVYRCDSAGECSKETCSSKDTDTFNKELNPNEQKILGATGCMSVNGFWGNGCFYANSACVFYRVFFPNVENGEIYEMFDCPHWKWLIELEITQSDLLQERVSNVVLSNELPTSSDIGSIRLHSVSVPPSPVLSDCFMSSSHSGENYVTLTNCNKKDQLIKGELGEIQCPSAYDAGNATNKCVFSSSIYSITTSGNDIQFSSEVINPRDTSKSKKLPLNFDGFMLDVDDKKPVARMFQSSLFQFSISSSQYKFSVLKERSTCSTTFLNLTGCYNCLGGSNICLKVDISKDSTILKIDCPTSKIGSVLMIYKTTREYCAKISSSIQRVQENCNIICSGNTESIMIKGDLSYDVNTIYKDNDNVVYGGLSVLKGLDFSSIGLWGISFISSGFIVTLIILIIVRKLLVHKTDKRFTLEGKNF